MSYSDYNYQQTTDINSIGNYDTSYNQSNQGAAQYGLSDQYSVSKGPQYNNQQDYSESYAQFPDVNQGNYFSSTNDYGYNSYRQDAGTENLSSGFNTSQSYQQASSYQYPKPAQSEPLVTSDSQIYSSNTGFNSSGLYNYSENNSFNNTLNNQEFEQSSYTHNSIQQEANRYSNQPFESQNNTVQPQSGFSLQYSKPDQYSFSSNAGNGNFQSENTNLSWGNPEVGDSQLSQSRFNDYQSTSGNYTNLPSGSGSYPNDSFDKRSTFDAFHNTQSDIYSYDANQNNLNSNKREDSLGGFSYSPNKEYGSFSQTGTGSFSQQLRTDSYSFPAGSKFSSQGSGGRNDFSYKRDESSAAMFARNNNNQGRFNSFQTANPVSGNTIANTGSWRGTSRSGLGQFSLNRGGMNSMNDTRDVKFNNVNNRGRRGFGDRPNQSRPQNQSSGSLGDRKQSQNRPFSAEVVKNKNEASSTNILDGSKPSHSFPHQQDATKKSFNNQEVGKKAPFYPNQKLLNEIEMKKDKPSQQDPNKSTETKNENNQKVISLDKTNEKKEGVKVEEEKDESTNESVKVLAPPSKPPETPEEIAREEEIQRKIRESIVVVNPDNEKQLLSDDPIKEVDMSEDLRDLLKTLTTEHFCKLCTLRMVGPQMATMHYNGKNHLKKVRIFVQTNGRSAGFNMETLKDDDSAEKPPVEKVAQEEEEDVDEKKFCKLCRVSFSQESQSEMHYKGKSHAKKLRSIANGSEIFECKICCVTVTAQEHLQAHLNGARHKLQIRKMEGDNAHRGGLRGRGGYRGRGGRGGGAGGEAQAGQEGNDLQSQRQAGFRGRGNARGRGQNWRGNFDRDGRFINDEEAEELYNLLGLTPEKRYKFDLANFRTPSGSFYCSACDITLDEEPKFMLHLASKKHYDRTYKGKKLKTFKVRIKVDQEFALSRTI